MLVESRRRDAVSPKTLRSPALAPGASVVYKRDEHPLSAQRELFGKHKMLPDEKFLSTVSDVVWRFHTYDQYGRKPEKALKALAKRAPGYSAEFYKERFELDLKLLVTTIEAVKEAPKFFKPENIYSQFSDVDSEYVMNKLHATFPDQVDDFLKGHLSMVIYWYYLR